MTDYPEIKLKAGKDANVYFGHPWVFSGAIAAKSPGINNGDLVKILDRQGKIMATGVYSDKSMIAVRVLDFKDAEINRDWLREKIIAANEFRKVLGYGDGTETTAYRVLFGESDGIPGLVIDKYEDILAIQIGNLGIENLKKEIVEVLVEYFKPKCVIERSDIQVRKDEGLKEVVEVCHGENPGEIKFKEYGLPFVTDILNGQKTGSFLDQKNLRKKISEFSHGKKVLNLFSYTGMTAIYAMKCGALSVTNVDSSELALNFCKQNAALNGISSEIINEQADIFDWLSNPHDKFDMVLMDPPALIKSKRDKDAGLKAYHFLNREAMKLVSPGGIFVTSSCSHFLPEEDLAFILRRTSVQNRRKLNIIDVVRQSADHPLSVYFPEGAYLKSFICQVV